jgi:hypothetical protein
MEVRIYIKNGAFFVYYLKFTIVGAGYAMATAIDDMP